jgi:hypothetical protein
MEVAIELAKDYSVANLAVIRHIATNQIETEKTAKVRLRFKRLKAGWNNDYLLRVIGEIKRGCHEMRGQ